MYIYFIDDTLKTNDKLKNEKSICIGFCCEIFWILAIFARRLRFAIYFGPIFLFLAHAHKRLNPIKWKKLEYIFW